MIWRIAIILALGLAPASAQLLTGVSWSATGGGAAVNNCNGAIDLSKGCPLPMLGGVL